MSNVIKYVYFDNAIHGRVSNETASRLAVMIMNVFEDMNFVSYCRSLKDIRVQAFNAKNIYFNSNISKRHRGARKCFLNKNMKEYPNF